MDICTKFQRFIFNNFLNINAARICEFLCILGCHDTPVTIFYYFFYIYNIICVYVNMVN